MSHLTVAPKISGIDLLFPNFSFWEEKLVAPLTATPNVDKCNRRHTGKAIGLGQSRENGHDGMHFGSCPVLFLNSL